MIQAKFVIPTKPKVYSLIILLIFVELLYFEVGDEIVDLTCESLEPVVVDLTHNDSAVIVEERRNGRRLRQDHADSCVVSSDDEELSRDKDVYVTTHTPRNTKDDGAPGPRRSGTLRCPICMDGYSEIV